MIQIIHIFEGRVGKIGSPFSDISNFNKKKTIYVIISLMNHVMWLKGKNVRGKEKRFGMAYMWIWSF